MTDATTPPAEPSAAELRARRLTRLNDIFTPALPVSVQSVFSGRAEQLRQVVDAVNRPGQHIVVLGEPGVGKTSLANIVSSRLATKERAVVAPRINCERIDDYSTIWKKVFSEVRVRREKARIGFPNRRQVDTASVGDSSPETITTLYVLQTLRDLSKKNLVVVIIDEFDRVGDPDVRAEFADTIKLLSDQGVRATLMIVGVADTVDDLIEQHRSIERALVQVHMPRMSPPELQQIVVSGLQLLEMSIEPAALARIAALSQGLPHYTHLLALTAATFAVEEDASTVTTTHLARAISQALVRTQQSIASAYTKATQQRDGGRSTFANVLLGCALAPPDETGTFSVTGVREALDEHGHTMPASTLSRALAALTKTSRGPVLERRGTRTHARYRFANPLVQPYVLMQAVIAQRLDPTTLERVQPLPASPSA